MTSTGSTLTLVPRELAIDSVNRKIYDTEDREDVRNKSFNMTVKVPDELKYYKRLSLVDTEIPLSGYNIRHEEINTNSMIIFNILYTSTGDEYPLNVKALRLYLSIKTEVFDNYESFIAAVNNDLANRLEDTIFKVTMYLDKNQIFDNNNVYYSNRISIRFELLSEDVDHGIYYIIWYNEGAGPIADDYNGLYLNELIGIDETIQTVLDPLIPKIVDIHGDSFVTNTSDIIIVQNGTNDQLQVVWLNDAGPEYGGATRLFRMPEGSYNEETFQDTLNDEMEVQIFATTDNYYKISYNPILLKYDMQSLITSVDYDFYILLNEMRNGTSDDDFIRIYATSCLTFLPLLGIDDVSPPVPNSFMVPGDETIVPGDIVAQLSTDDYLFVGVNVVRGQTTNLTADYPNLWDKGIIAKIQLTQPPSSMQFYKNQDPLVFDLYNNLAGDGINALIVDDLVVTIYRKDGTMYDTNGANWSLTLRLYI